MMTGQSKTYSGARFFLLFIPAAFATYAWHDAGHRIIGECLGNAMTHGLNNVSPQAGHYLHASHALWVSIGGPAFSLLQAVVALLSIAWLGWRSAYPWAYFAAFNPAVALLPGGFGAQDEARIAALIGGWPYAVPLVVLGALMAITMWCSRRLSIGLRTNLNVAVASTACRLLVIGTCTLLSL
jgi:hypothetical protein